MLIFKRFKRAIPLPLPPYSTYADLPVPVYEMVEKNAIKYWPPSTKKMAIICGGYTISRQLSTLDLSTWHVRPGQVRLN